MEGSGAMDSFGGALPLSAEGFLQPGAHEGGGAGEDLLPFPDEVVVGGERRGERAEGQAGMRGRAQRDEAREGDQEAEPLLREERGVVDEVVGRAGAGARG